METTEKKLFKVTWMSSYMRPRNSNTHETYAYIRNEEEALALIDILHGKDTIKFEQVALDGIIVTKQNTLTGLYAKRHKRGWGF